MKILGLEPFLGIIISKTKLMHGKPLCVPGLDAFLGMQEMVGGDSDRSVSGPNSCFLCLAFTEAGAGAISEDSGLMDRLCLGLSVSERILGSSLISNSVETDETLESRLSSSGEICWSFGPSPDFLA